MSTTRTAKQRIVVFAQKRSSHAPTTKMTKRNCSEFQHSEPTTHTNSNDYRISSTKLMCRILWKKSWDFYKRALLPACSSLHAFVLTVNCMLTVHDLPPSRFGALIDGEILTQKQGATTCKQKSERRMTASVGYGIINKLCFESFMCLNFSKQKWQKRTTIKQANKHKQQRTNKAEQRIPFGIIWGGWKYPFKIA